MVFLSSHVLQPTRHLQGTPLQPFRHFSDPSFSALVPLRYLSSTPTLNAFVLLTQWSTSYSHLFVGKTHRVMARLVRLAADLATLHLLAYPRGSKVGFGIAHPCSWNPATRSRKHGRLRLRRGARTVRVVSIRRNVRMYAPDLAKTAASWATRPPSRVAHAPNVFARFRDWERVAPPTLKLMPGYADNFKSAWTFLLISTHIRALHRPMRLSLPLPQYPYWEIARQCTLVQENQLPRERSDSGV